MKKLFFLLFSIVLFIGILPQTVSAQKKTVWVAPKVGVWKVYGKDVENIVWNGRMHLTKRTKDKAGIHYKGYFSWVSEDEETSGREFFTGLFSPKTGRLYLKASSVKNERGELGVGNYIAAVNQKGRKISRGRWSGKNVVKGIWSAEWIKFR
ncbi:MAG TPA: hypothetical protein PKY59_12785 [Pyrinomonadaceae bacterium]|nr:hypothetical protein [Pyrinomonadaceae bacterium]